MKVIVSFTFEGVDPNSEQGKQIVAEIAESCETMGIGFNADACVIDDVEVD
jgi:hypothetical protein